MIYAQDTTDTTLGPVDPERPLTDFLTDLLDLEPGSMTTGVLGVLVEPLLQIIVIVLLAIILSRLLRAAVRATIRRFRDRPPRGRPLAEGDSAVVSTRRAQRLDALATVLSSTVSFLVWAVAIATIFGRTIGLDVGPLIAGAGILGIALGFGAQDLVKDMLTGMFMLVEDQFGVGDVVDLGEAVGVVEGVGLRTTRVREVTGTLWHIPNGEIRRVGNMSQEWSRSLMDVAVGYGSDLDRAAEIIKQAADGMAEEDAYRDLFLTSPEIWGVQEIQRDAVVIRLVVKTVPGEQWAISRELRRRVKMALDEAGIELPFPQQTLWLRRDIENQTPDTYLRDPSMPSAATGKAAAEEGATDTAVEEPDPPQSA